MNPLLESGPAGWTAGQMGGHEARSPGSESAVGVPLESGSNHSAAQAPHVRQYTSTCLDVAPPLIICDGNLKVVTWKLP